jgi:hypothetical protein
VVVFVVLVEWGRDKKATQATTVDELENIYEKK